MEHVQHPRQRRQPRRQGHTIWAIAVILGAAGILTSLTVLVLAETWPGRAVAIGVLALAGLLLRWLMKNAPRRAGRSLR